MKNCPIHERPREKAIQYGIESLSHSELVALILRTGSKEKSVLYLAQYVLDQIGGFQALKDVSFQQLTKIKGIKQAKAIELLASVELAKRMQNFKKESFIIKEPIDGYRLVKNKLLFEKQEKFILICLNTKLEVILEKVLFIGSIDYATIDPRIVLSHALKADAHRIVLIHNHPSGNPMPSLQDREFTDKMRRMADFLDIEFVDHLIIGRQSFYSFALGSICEDD